MGQTHFSGAFFREVQIQDDYELIQTLWSEDDMSSHIQKLKETTLNFSLDRVKFVNLLQLSTTYETLVDKWFEHFSHNRAARVVDGLEFLSASIMISSRIQLFRKICLLYSLFDLDKSGCIRKDEFTIFLKSVTIGLHRMLSGLPPPVTLQVLGAVSTDYCSTLPGNVVSQREFLMWVTEAQYALNYVSVLSRLGSAVFAMGVNRRYQLGLNMEPREQRVPAPVLSLEGIRVASIASNESHCLFLTQEGQVWSCGSGFCGILGHGNVMDSPQPQRIECMAHVRVVDVAVGVRHSVAVSEKGQVFSWGAADLGQLGHGSTEDREIHEWASDPKTGGSFAYVTKPTVVMGLFGKRIFVRKASCCNFTTVVLTDQDTIYSWGNNTDGQCGHGQRCPDHCLIYVDSHMHRTAMQVLTRPRLLQLPSSTRFKSISCGGYHVLALDEHSRLWTWGQGLWGKLGHADQRSMYEPRLVDSLRYHICQCMAAGESHSACLCALFRLTVTGSSASVPFTPFSLLGLPVGRVDCHLATQRVITPPNTTLQLNAFSSAPLLQVGLPFHFHPTEPIFDPERVRNCIVLMARPLWEGEWLKLSVTDVDFSVRMSSTAAVLAPSQPVRGAIMMADGANGAAAMQEYKGKICIFDVGPGSPDAPHEVQESILELAARCQKGAGLACICVLPKGVIEFDIEVPASVGTIPIGVMSHDMGQWLRKHVVSGQASGGPGVQAALVVIKEDRFLDWLKRVLTARPKGVIVSQSSWRPDVEHVDLPESMFNAEELDIPVAMVSFEAGEELRGAVNKGQEPHMTFEIQRSGGLFAWGNGSFGQLGLSGIENRNLLSYSQNALTGEENAFVNKPYYVAHLHEHQVTGISCGAAHTIAVTEQGEVFTWGAADSLGVQVNGEYSGVPLCVEQLDGIVRATAAFAGGHHSFVVADMPFKSVLQ